jgi:hypothetical protein
MSPKRVFDTKTYWPTGRQSQCDFDFQYLLRCTQKTPAFIKPEYSILHKISSSKSIPNRYFLYLQSTTPRHDFHICDSESSCLIFSGFPVSILLVFIFYVNDMFLTHLILISLFNLKYFPKSIAYPDPVENWNPGFKFLLEHGEEFPCSSNRAEQADKWVLFLEKCWK